MKQAILLSISMAMLVPQAVPAPPQENIEPEIRNLEARRIRALTEADVPVLERLLSDDTPSTPTRAAAARSKRCWPRFAPANCSIILLIRDDVNVHGFGNLVLATGRAAARVRAKGQELNVRLLYLEAYVKQDGRW